MRNLSYLLLFLLLFLLFSCSPEKRIARILRNNPSLVKSDTIYKYDTIHIAGVHKDSTFNYYQHDTVFLKKDNLSIKYYLNHDSTVFLQGKCDPIIKVVKVPIQVNSVSVNQNLAWYDKVKLFLFNNGWWIAILIYLVVQLLKKVKVL